MALYPGGCLKINIPVVIWDSCRNLDNGQTAEIGGSCVKQAATRRLKNSVKIFVEKRDEMMSFSLFAAAMGDVLQKKLSQTWKCDINMAEIPHSEQMAMKTEMAVEEALQTEDAEIVDNVEMTSQTIGHLTASLGPNMPSVSTADQTTFVEKVDFESFVDAMMVDQTTIDEGKDVDEDNTEDLYELAEVDETKDAELVKQEPETSSRKTKRKKTTKRKSKEKKGQAIEHVESDKKKTVPVVKKRKMYAPRDAKVEDLVCEFCNRSWFTSVPNYNRHMRSCNKNPEAEYKDEDAAKKKIYTCDVCNLTTPSLHQLKRHRKTIHNLLDIHVNRKRKPEGPRDYTCRYCGIVYHWRGSKNLHENFRCKSNPNVRKGKYCKTCKKFCALDDYEKHIAESHPNGIDYICDVCGGEFHSIGTFFRHQKDIHFSHNAKKHKCDICGEEFLYRNKLTRHMSRHSDEKDYPCEICGKSYKFMASLNRHQRFIHENKYTYKCDKCGHGVEKLSYLKAHICGRVRRAPKEDSSFTSIKSEESDFSTLTMQFT